MKKEESLHIAICKYIKLQYPKIVFTSESSGLRLTIGQAKKLKDMRSSNALPDILILEPSRGRHGLFLEVKTESPFKKNGKIKSNAHLQEQHDMLNILVEKGFDACFVWDFEMAKEIIYDYVE